MCKGCLFSLRILEDHMWFSQGDGGSLPGHDRSVKGVSPRAEPKNQGAQCTTPPSPTSSAHSLLRPGKSLYHGPLRPPQALFMPKLKGSCTNITQPHCFLDSLTPVAVGCKYQNPWGIPKGYPASPLTFPTLPTTPSLLQAKLHSSPLPATQRPTLLACDSSSLVLLLKCHFLQGLPLNSSPFGVQILVLSFQPLRFICIHCICLLATLRGPQPLPLKWKPHGSRDGLYPQGIQLPCT